MAQLAGIGVDIVRVEKFNQVIEDNPQALDSIFTEFEQSYCKTSRNRAERLAARFAAKEAVLKALGLGMAKGMNWLDIEVQNVPTGQPILKLGGEVERRALHQGLNSWQLSLSHCREYAIACVSASNEEVVAQGENSEKISK